MPVQNPGAFNLPVITLLLLLLSFCSSDSRRAHPSVTFAALILLQRLKRLKAHSSVCYFCCSRFAPATQATQGALIRLLLLLLSFCSSDSSDSNDSSNSRCARHSVTLAALVLLQQLKSALILCRSLVMSRLYGPGK
ncbi:hypothetical protein EDB19DRAFT_1836111 [Suillus lakei]|nr:hypothetical protein EDB19DRAFT_1836111 [Suillus lakei]